MRSQDRKPPRSWTFSWLAFKIILPLGALFTVTYGITRNIFTARGGLALLSIAVVFALVDRLLWRRRVHELIGEPYKSLTATTDSDGTDRESTVWKKSTSTALASFARQRSRERHLAMLVLLLAGGTHTLVAYQLEISALWPALLLVGAAVLLQIGDAATGYRLNKGLYGTNEYEARQIILFVLSRTEDADLSGGLGAADIQIDDVTQTILCEAWGLATR